MVECLTRDRRAAGSSLAHARIQAFSSGGGGGGGGGEVQARLTKKTDKVFFLFLLVYHFSRFQRGSNIFQGGSNFFQGGGVQLLIPYRNPYNVIFQGGVGSGPPVPPLDLHLSPASLRCGL